ncbi:MAG: hypothetical protein Q9170_006909 [Blastenia crenularia]
MQSRSKTPITLLVILFFGLVTICSSTPPQCDARTKPPTNPSFYNCQEFLEILSIEASREPRGAYKYYGRHLEPCQLCVKLPVIIHYGTINCAAIIDVDDEHEKDLSIFGIIDLRQALADVVGVCWLGKRCNGRGFPAGMPAWAGFTRGVGPSLDIARKERTVLANWTERGEDGKSIEVGAKPIVITPPEAEMHYALQDKLKSGQVEWIQRGFQDSDVKSLGRDEVENVVDAVFVTLGGKESLGTRTHISTVCRRLRIPVNVLDSPNLCTFSLPSTHSDGPLQIGITTSGKGCKLATRIRREIASLLPPNFGSAIERIGTIRRRIWEEDHRCQALEDLSIAAAENEDDDIPAQKPTFNQLVTESDLNAVKTRRIRWLSQICEYWPLRRLASIKDGDIDAILQSYTTHSQQSTATQAGPPLNISTIDLRNQPAPRIILAGSGPGSPSLLTLATHRAIQTATVILADKLVPSPILDLIPRRTPLHIARKFPGNAEAAQQELLTLGLEALQKGETVLRLKQGDPYIYGRGSEEYTWFEERGFKPVVLPGITSALSAPLFAGVPCTSRGVSDQVLICTGTGRKGKAPDPPAYGESKTVVFLMALHRVGELVESLVASPLGNSDLGEEDDKLRMAIAWPKETPCAVVERASCSDQRVIRSTLEFVVQAVENEGSRPPGLLVLGKACEVLKGRGGARWVVEEGFEGFDGLDDLAALQAGGGGMIELAAERERDRESVMA